MKYIIFLLMILCIMERGGCQSKGRYVNDGIAMTREIACQDLYCGDSGACDLNGTTLCEGLPAWCPGPEVYCVPKPKNKIHKPGICVDADYIPNHDMECFTDWGCPDNQLCCHGYYGSRCVAAKWDFLMSQSVLRRIVLFLRLLHPRNQEPVDYFNVNGTDT